MIQVLLGLLCGRGLGFEATAYAALGNNIAGSGGVILDLLAQALDVPAPSPRTAAQTEGAYRRLPLTAPSARSEVLYSPHLEG